LYKDHNEAFATLQKMDTIEPDTKNTAAYEDAYNRWKQRLESSVKENK